MIQIGDMPQLLQFLVLLRVVLCIDVKYVDEDAVLRTPNLIKKYGYPVELHNVVTKDGYILTHHRIPHGKDEKGKRRTRRSKPVVLLQHGLLGSSSDWILKMPQFALGYILADKGYDVWLMNNRGNEYSEKHLNLHPLKDRRAFWDFSWHEMGIYDLPNTIDYVLNATDQREVFHIGHSQGTTSLFVMLSERPEYNEKITAHISYSPIAFHKYTISVMFRALAPIEALGGLSALKLILGEFNFAPSTSILRFITSWTCHDGEQVQFLCYDIFFMLMGYNPAQMNTTMLPAIYGHFPAGSSMMQMAHYIQEINSGKFRKFDYGPCINNKRYRQSYPPDYTISNIKAPVYTFYGGKDSFAQLRDVEKFHSLLPNLKRKHFIENWAHMDFLFGIDATRVIYDKTLDILNSYLNT